MDNNFLVNCLTSLTNGYLLSDDDRSKIQDYCKYVLNVDPKSVNNENTQIRLINIIKIANIYYNNNFNGLLLIDDNIYDRIVVLLRQTSIPIPIGAPRIELKESIPNSNNTLLESKQGSLKQVVRFSNAGEYFNTLTSNATKSLYDDYVINPDDNDCSYRKLRNTGHRYDLCGTLDKCKFVTDLDAKSAGVFDDTSVMVFERDFLNPHIKKGIVNPNDITIIASLKYDGISVEATVQGDTIISACSRGDMANNEASDLTPILGGMKFKRAEGISKQDEFGIKFEFIVNSLNMNRLLKQYKVNYVNHRNAIIGLFGRLDARAFRDYMTPVPLESSLDTDRITEIQFLNKYYTKGLDLRHIVIRGNKSEVLKQLSEFVEEASNIRSFMPFAYDGIVVEYVDPNIRNILGKLNSIPRYSVAIKFNPLKRQSIFTHYTYSVGYTGTIIPMAHFEPVDFMGAIHDKTTIHSYARFKKLRLCKGDKVNLSLNNDVIVYLTKAEDDNSREDREQYLEKFPTHCPSCGTRLEYSLSGDTAYCPNFYCRERSLNRIAGMLQKLGVKDFGLETVRALDIKNVIELFNVDTKRAQQVLGINNGIKFKKTIEALKDVELPDYRVLASLGFPGIGNVTWLKLLQGAPIDVLLNGTIDDLANCYRQSRVGIGPKTVRCIITEREHFKEEIEFLYKNLKILNTTVGVARKRKVVVFSGIRDQQLEKLFEEKGFRISNSFINDCTVLVVPNIGFTSSKVEKAFNLVSKRMTMLFNKPYKADYTNLEECIDIRPNVMDINMAYDYIKSYIPENFYVTEQDNHV